MDKKIIKTEKNNILIQNSSKKSPKINIEQFLIGTEKRSLSYQNQGNTKYNTYNYFYFGVNLFNSDETDIQVNFKISEIDKDGYSVKDWNISKNIEPNEKRRLWSSFEVSSLNDFKRYKLKLIEINTIEEKFIKKINTTIFQILNLNASDNISFKARSGLTWLFKAILTIIGVIVFWYLLYKLFI